MPVLSELGRLAERGELEIGEKVAPVPHYRIARQGNPESPSYGHYWVGGPDGYLWVDGVWRKSPEDYGGYYATLAEAVDALKAALIAAGRFSPVDPMTLSPTPPPDPAPPAQAEDAGDKLAPCPICKGPVAVQWDLVYAESSILCRPCRLEMVEPARWREDAGPDGRPYESQATVEARLRERWNRRATPPDRRELYDLRDRLHAAELRAAADGIDAKRLRADVERLTHQSNDLAKANTALAHKLSDTVAEAERLRVERDAVINSLIARSKVHHDVLVPEPNPNGVYKIASHTVSIEDHGAAVNVIRRAAGLPESPS